MATVFFYLHIFTGSVGRKILLEVPVDTLCRNSIISSSTVLPLNLFVDLFLLLSLYSCPMDQTLGCGPTVGSPRSSSTPPSLRRGRVVPPPCKKYRIVFITSVKISPYPCRLINKQGRNLFLEALDHSWKQGAIKRHFHFYVSSQQLSKSFSHAAYSTFKVQ